MPGNGNGGGGIFDTGFKGISTGEGGRTTEEEKAAAAIVSGEGGRTGKPDWSKLQPPAPEPPPPPPPPGYGDPGYVKEATNIQRANIDRTSFYDPTGATQQMGAEYLASRNASNPQPIGTTGAGAVGYSLPDGSFGTNIYGD